MSMVVPASGQNHVRRAMQRAREQQDALTHKGIEPSRGGVSQGYLPFVVENGDTTYLDTIDPVWVFSRGKGKGKGKGKSDKDWRKYYKLVYNFAKVYPYALASGRLQEIVDSTIAAEHMNRFQKDRYMTKVQNMLFKDFEGALHHMTITQGGLLLKLIDRETGQSSYTIIHDYKNSAAAGFWQMIAKWFDNDLKATYDPEGADKDIEELVRHWQDGTFNNLYYSIFWEDPPVVKVPDFYKRPQSVKSGQ